jgi:hypothetical protein
VFGLQLLSLLRKEIFGKYGCFLPGQVMQPGCEREFNWTIHNLSPSTKGFYFASQSAPSNGGWTLFFMEFIYYVPSRLDPTGTSNELKLTTEVNIVPNVFPFESCGLSCHLKPIG